MRREGAASRTRTVEVRKWGDWDRDRLAYSCPPLFQASYFDQEQGLTTAEGYVARVHDWHAVPDSYNRRAEANRSKYGMAYGDWVDVWGPKPVECSVCGVGLVQRS